VKILGQILAWAFVGGGVLILLGWLITYLIGK